MANNSVLHWRFLITTLIFSVSLKFGACYITGQWGKFRVTIAILCLHTFLSFFCCFSSIFFCFYHFRFFFDEVSNIRNEILTNQKPELVVLAGAWFYRIILFKKLGDIEPNSVPKRDINQCFSVCHWNQSSVLSHNLSKIQSLITIAYINSTLFTSLLDECHLNSEILSSDTNLQIPCYNFARIDNPLDIRGGMCLYNKQKTNLRILLRI